MGQLKRVQPRIGQPCWYGSRPGWVIGGTKLYAFIRWDDGRKSSTVMKKNIRLRYIKESKR